MSERLVAHSRPTMGEGEAEAAARVVRSGLLAQGPEVELFEAEVASFTGRRFAVAVSSGTAALHLGLLALGVGSGDCVAIPSYVCTALLHAIWAAGAEPVLCDVNPQTRNIDADLLDRLIKIKRPRAAIIPHMFGLPASTEAFDALSIPYIEDCAMSIGAHHAGRPLGSHGALSICSFYATKMLGAGEGGMVLTDDEGIALAARELREYDGAPAHRLRFNAKMTDLHAAVGRVQLRRLPEFVARRREVAQLYQEEFISFSNVKTPLDNSEHIYYRYVLKVVGQAEVFIERLEKSGVAARRPIYNPLHRELGLADGEYPHTTAAFECDVSLPIYPTLIDSEARCVLAAVRNAALHP